MQGQDDNMEVATVSPPLSSPLRATMVGGHQHRPSTASVLQQRSKRSSSRITDGATSKQSDDEAKTAVRVAVRVRPPLQPTDPGYELIPQRFRGSTCEVPTPTSLSVQSPQGKKLFVFDRVFDEDTTQEGIWDYLSDSVTSFVKGYNVSILAYGQSGSGKSYTMGTSGPEDQSKPSVAGIVPRAAQALFDKLEGPSTRQSGIQAPKRYSTQGIPTLSSLPKNGYAAKNWELKASYVEIYNEQLRDLLLPDTVPLHERTQVTIREDTKGRILLTGLTQVPINSVDDLLGALNFGSSIRQTDATAVNARSSRSHAVFSLNLIQKKGDARPNSPTPRNEKRVSTPVDVLSGENIVTIDSKLHFVDLAGSERLKNTQATGERAKEGIAINGGLAALGKVISQLSSKHGQAHISYRDSRLTRLLQDSLGGNAITFMVACVTPASFHLSETLNTVSYAQRARAIQSKPEIQQSHEDGDKQVAIERLRAEIAFLREQIKHSDYPDRRSSEIGRSERSRREAELETQLMDMEDNYKALSQRHAKLISELSKARDGDTADTPFLKEAMGENATARIQRSSSFAEAVEQMVLEYEKTIQSLESSLTKTRTSLSKTESTLLEKETRIAYMETIQQQLQARIQKAADREQSNESYLRDLETRMEGTTSGEERNASVIAELKRELARLRESEDSAEDYISTLEERLAEAEQDQEIMQREIERLEHVVERQRSIGRLDNLLGELDGIRQNRPSSSADHGVQTAKGPAKPKINGHRESYDPFRPPSPNKGNGAEADDEDGRHAESEPPILEEPDDVDQTEKQCSLDPTSPALADIEEQRTPTQNDFMEDKLENLTQELFDLRSEHEAQLIDYDNLQQKYQTALETLAKLQYDEERPKSPLMPTASRPSSFLADAGMKEEEKADVGGKPSSSRSLSAELASPGPSSTSEDEGHERLRNGVEIESSGMSGENAVTVTEATAADEEVSPVDDELESLKKRHAEKESSVTELTKNYEDLAQRHEDALAQIEDLKQEIHRLQNSFRPTSPGINKALWRRRSDDKLGSSNDRASRSFASLKNIALENFESNPDTRQSFELNLNNMMTELHNKHDKVQLLEAELVAVRKELESKQTIISGLTRERSSLAASSGVDFSVVGQMREQLLESEQQIRLLHEQHASREKDLQAEIESLKASLAHYQEAVVVQSGKAVSSSGEGVSYVPGTFPEMPALAATPTRELGSEQATADAKMSEEDTEHAAEITRLQNELAAWETKHNSAIESMKASEAKLLETIADLEESMRLAESNSRSTGSVTPVPSPAKEAEAAAAVASFEEERAKHKQIVEALQNEVEQYKVTANDQILKLEQLEQAYANIMQKVDEESNSTDLTEQELKTHKELVGNLENQLRMHKDAINMHQDTLESLQANHSKEIEQLKLSMDAAEKESKQRLVQLEEHHALIVQNLQADLQNSQRQVTEILRSASSALGYETDPSQLHSQIKGLVEEGKELHTRHLKSTNELKAVQEELQNALSKIVALENKISELKMINEETILNLEKVSEKERKSARLVEELEDQLNNTFDSHQRATHRMSTMQTETVQARMELERELEDQKLKNNVLEQQIATLKRQSTTSNSSAANFNRESLSPEAAAIALARSSSQASIRKSAGTALPTPPPSVPLPPLPNSPTNNLDRGTSPIPRAASPVTSASPPGSRHTSKDVGPSMSQLVEEQEARIRTIEKHLFAEKQLTATLEEALVDLENSANRTKAEMETWRKKCSTLEDELVSLRKDRSNSRASLQAVEEEREMRLRAERARQALEQRMMELNSTKKKKKNALNCF